MRKNALIVVFFCALVAQAGCGGAQAAKVEVTRTVVETSEVAVEKVVEVQATTAPDSGADTQQIATTSLPEATPTSPTTGFAANYLGKLTDNGITLEFARILCDARDARETTADQEGFQSDKYVCMFLWRMTNDSDEIVRWPDVQYVRVNDKQIGIVEWLYGANTGFGAGPTEKLYPGSTVIGGLWVGVGELEPDDITSAALLFTPAENMDFDQVTGDFVIQADIPLPHSFEPLPDELK